MEDAYTSAFYGLVKETQERSGLELPTELEAYVVMLLATFTDRPNYLPEDSFAESYLKLQRPADLTAKELGDTCLFVTGVFPEYGSRRGMSRRYYQNIGIGSYEMVAEVFHKELFSNLARHFEFVSDFIEITTHSNNRWQRLFHIKN